MLGRNQYDQEYIDASRARIAAQVSAYRKLVAASNGDARVGAAIDEFEPLFFNNMVLALDNLFVHRLRKMEGKDGNPLNQVRAICTSLMSGDDEIRLNEDDFVRLSDGFLAEIESRYAG